MELVTKLYFQRQVNNMWNTYNDGYESANVDNNSLRRQKSDEIVGGMVAAIEKERYRKELRALKKAKKRAEREAKM